jgi:ABC-2 type transport system permease protein
LNLRKVLSVARKEYLHLIRDFRSLYLAFIIPVLLIILFGYALSLDVDEVKTVVVDYDKTEDSRDLIRRLESSSYFSVVTYLRDSDGVADYLDYNKAVLGFIIPPDWTENLRSDRKSPLQVIIDGSDPNLAGITRSYVMAFLAGENQKFLLSFLNRNGLEKINMPVEGRIRVWFNEDLESSNFIVPGIIAIILIIVGALLTSMVIAREYENGTMETIRSLPLKAPEFLIGKAIPYFLIGFIDMLIAVMMGQFLFGVVMKSSFWVMVSASSIYLFVALCIGLLISTLTKSQLVANQVAILITYLPSFMLSNFVFPIENMPSVLQKITYFVPARYYIDILTGIYLRDLGLLELWPDFLVLMLMFSILVILNVMVLRREGL